MTKTTESVLFLFSPTTQACYSLSSAPTKENNETIGFCLIFLLIVRQT